MEGDAFAALALLRSDPRLDPNRIGVMGVSKGGGATLNAAIAVRQRWRRGFDHLFDLHVAICPGATSQHRDPATHGRPIYFMLAGRDDSPLPARHRLRRAHACGRQPAGQGEGVQRRPSWLGIAGPVFDIRDAENWSCCKNFIEDDGNHFVVAAGRVMPNRSTRRGHVSIVSPAALAPAAARPT